MGSYNYYKMFGCFNRKFKISEAEPPPDVRTAFDRYAEGGAYMRADQLLKFLVEYQLEKGCTTADAEAIMNGVFHHRHHSAKRPGLTLDDFFHFLFQDDLNGPIISQVHHDMTAPLQHYFIYTGHNSYLTGNQLSSDCSEIPIIKSLENGVRGIELDLWPNSGKDSVHVLHGRTLTTPIPLMKCLKSIKEHAFIKSPYPVIITLEDHLTSELQAKVAEMVIQIFGDLLYYPESGCLEAFPSPEELKHKIMLSTKPPKEYLESKHIKDPDISSPMEKDSSEEVLLREEPGQDNKSSSGHDDEDVDSAKQKTSNMPAPEFKRLTAFHTGMVKEGMTHAIKNGNNDSDDNEYLVSNNIMDDSILWSMEKDSSEEELTSREMSDATAEPYANDKSDNNQGNEDIDFIQQKSSKIAAPEFKRLTAIHTGMVKKGMTHTIKDGDNDSDHNEYLLSNNIMYNDILCPMEKDSSEEELTPRETSNANDKSDNNQENEDIDSIQQKSSKMAAPEFKRLTAIHTGMVKRGIKHTARNDSSHINPIESMTMDDQDISSPIEIDSFEDELVLSEIEARDKCESFQDDGGINFIQQKSSITATVEFQRLTAIQTRKAKKGLSEDQVISSPMKNDSSEDESLLRNMSDLIAEPEADDKSESDPDDEDIDFTRQKSGNLSAPEYKRLIAIHAGKVKKSLRHALRNGSNKVNRLSLSEQILERAATSYPMDVVRFSQKNILRVFPKGTRVTSSNFKPSIGWTHGAQMIAFNMQGYGKSLWMMHGMFRSNGGCGYVKKPDLLMKTGPNNEVFDPKIPLPVKKTLKVTVYMGDGWRLDFSHTHFDSFSPPDFYTKVYIIGVPADAAKRKTRIIEDDWGPYWGEEFTFPLSVPELALLRIEVREHDLSDKDDFGGQTCLPILELRPGIRAIPLYDKKGQKLKSVRLLMRFQFE